MTARPVAALLTTVALTALACGHNEASSGSGPGTHGESGAADGDPGDGDPGDGDPGDGDPGDGDPGDGDPDPGTAALQLPPGHTVNTGRVATAHVCETCHANSDQAEAMRDEAGRGVAPHDLWRSSMMANAARDPFWHAMVEGEVLSTPAAAAAIEAKCTRCHTPLLAAELELSDAGSPALATLHEPDSDHGALGLDGVSCTLCHQIEDEQLGQPASFSGGWTVAGEGRIYGPHDQPFTMPMVNHVDMTPTLGEHIVESATCATCHTLFTEALTPEGGATGASLGEQTPYLEWQNSAFSTEAADPGPQAASCQDCHAPKLSEDGLPISTRIAHRPMGDDFPPIDDRSPYGRHLFVGGNTLMLELIRDYAQVLQPNASAAAFEATIAATRAQLEQATAELTIAPIVREGDTLRIPVTISSLVGHKLPTGFPSRRVFLWVELRDVNGQLVFRSGGHDERGRLLDGEGQVLASELVGGPVAPHLDELGQQNQAQIWEAVMADTEGQPTYRLLRGASYYKDNRLLPTGWDPQLASEAIAAVGVAGDPDFGAGGDTVSVVVEAPADAGPYEVEARAYYQPLSPRFVAELFALDGPRIRAFEAMLETTQVAPERLATAQRTTD
ncbi:hypothetical protein ENSA5_36610 [Enhygromyxa salina]|uniref:Uncharacterized protein n=1 Tax=Enhygromyxa salina TaxID=215803 RepID=A0A2S9XUP7_9BACT|nr:hypothetical protein [Enhygromyxa salina]PRP96585.1 hypothetical protein ENSA5_36610 [Enhygromyxa salina]